MSTVAEANTAPTTQSWSAWHIDPRHSLAQFSVRHMMLSKVRGQFTGISGTIVDAADDPKRSSVKAAIDVTTLITGDPQRDEHLRSPDFFDVANHPTMTFESRSISGSREHFKVTGDVTINGLGTNPLGQAVAGFTAVTQLNRKDFGLNWNMALEAGGFLVGDNAALEIELEAVRADPAPAADAR